MENNKEQELKQNENVTDEELTQPCNKIENNLVTQKKHRGLMIASFIFLAVNLIIICFNIYIMVGMLKSLNSEDSGEKLGGVIIAVILGIPLIIISDIYISISHIIFLISHITKLIQKKSNKIERVQFICFVALTILFLAANIVFFVIL